MFAMRDKHEDSAQAGIPGPSRELIDALPSPTPPSTISKEEFDRYKAEQQKRHNDLVDVLEITIAELKKAKQQIRNMESSQAMFFSVQEDLRLRFELLTGNYKRMDFEDENATNRILLDKNGL